MTVEDLLWTSLCCSSYQNWLCLNTKWRPVLRTKHETFDLCSMINDTIIMVAAICFIYYYYYSSLFIQLYSLLSSRLTALMSHVILNEVVYWQPIVQTPNTGLRHPSFKEEGVGKRCWECAYYFGCCMAGATWNCCRLGVSSVRTIKNAQVNSATSFKAT